MTLIAKLQRKWRYRSTWGTPIGQDCISLDTSLCKWLGERLVFLGNHANSHHPDYNYEEWQKVLHDRGQDLLAWTKHWDCETAKEETAMYERAQQTLHWVADNLGTLWD